MHSIPPQPGPVNRRQFLQRGTLATAALAFPFVASRNVLGANNRLNVAAIGAGGKGAVDVDGCSGENLVALCDVDDANAAGTFKKHPGARRFRDFRVMLEKEGRSIDAVTVSTPDHMHAPAALMAMKLGKHVYCQKPLTHTVQEARMLLQEAHRTKVATQMGNQGHSNPGLRRLVELVQGGVLGEVREVHCWTDRPIWPQGIPRPSATPPVPASLDFELWLGVAPVRPYSPEYVPFKWRGFWDFGTGALGDMACHVMDLPFWALNLTAPVSVEALSSEVTRESAPKSATILYDFPANGPRGPLRMIWYDGGRKPSDHLVKGRELAGNGVVIVGSKDTLYVPSYWGDGLFLSGAKTADFASVPEKFKKHADFDRAHYQEWIDACKGGPKALSNFDASVPLTEAVLLGNIALRTGRRLQWDSKRMKIPNAPEAEAYLTKTYRPGWGL